MACLQQNAETQFQTANVEKPISMFSLCTAVFLCTHAYFLTHTYPVPAWQTSPVNWACKSCAQHQWRSICHFQRLSWLSIYLSVLKRKKHGEAYRVSKRSKGGFWRGWLQLAICVVRGHSLLHLSNQRLTEIQHIWENKVSWGKISK